MYERNNNSQLQQIEALGIMIGKLSRAYTKSHVKRLKAGKCKPKSGIIYIDIINDLERCADQAQNIAESIVPEGKRVKR